MCLAVPGIVCSIKDDKAVVNISGMKIETFINLLDDVKIGDYLLLHSGFAIQKLSKEEAEETFKLLDEINR